MALPAFITEIDPDDGGEYRQIEPENVVGCDVNGNPYLPPCFHEDGPPVTFGGALSRLCSHYFDCDEGDALTVYRVWVEDDGHSLKACIEIEGPKFTRTGFRDYKEEADAYAWKFEFLQRQIGEQSYPMSSSKRELSKYFMKAVSGATRLEVTEYLDIEYAKVAAASTRSGFAAVAQGIEQEAERFAKAAIPPLEDLGNSLKDARNPFEELGKSAIGSVDEEDS